MFVIRSFSPRTTVHKIFRFASGKSSEN